MFSQPSCQPCKQLEPILQAACNAVDIELQKWDVSENWDLAEEYNVKSTPTVFVMTDENKAMAKLESRTVVNMVRELKSYKEVIQ